MAPDVVRFLVVRSQSRVPKSRHDLLVNSAKLDKHVNENKHKSTSDKLPQRAETRANLTVKEQAAGLCGPKKIGIKVTWQIRKSLMETESKR